MPTLYLLTGPWASGKSSIVEHLVRLLPTHAVFDWDLVIPFLSLSSGKDVRTDPSTWNGLRETWRAMVGASLNAGRDVVLCGPPLPDEFLPDLDPPSSVRRAYLDCPNAVLVERLRARGATDAEVADELCEASTLRASSTYRIAVDDGPEDVAERVAKWVESAR